MRCQYDVKRFGSRRWIVGLAGAALLSGSAMIAATAGAAEIMPSFAGVPAGWVTDRYDPASFSNVGIYQGRSDVLGIEIDSAQGFTGRPGAYQSTFYNTQGRQYATSGGAGSTLSADLWIPASWSDASTGGSARTDMWGVMVDGSDAVSGYPIIGFTNFGGAPRYRAWSQAGVWIDLATTVSYDAWTAFSIEFTGTDFVYYINGAPVYTEADSAGSVAFSATIMQAYNFFDDPSIVGANPQDYTAHWSNVVPEPGTLLLLTGGVTGLATRRRRLP